MVYLLRHRIPHSDAQIIYEKMHPGTIALKEEIKKLKKRGSSWQCAIFTTYALPVTRQLFEKYLSKDIDLNTCGYPERGKILRKELWTDYPGRPYRATIHFWHPLAKCIDFDGIFHSPQDFSEEIKLKMKKIRLFLQN